ncbi:mitochondrial potassium channel isoform X2 [Xenopus tropicalis]|uniref:Coiled-coil domain containing 51 n=1 Tax=Xenopus tropicalis TaxID=8364 RepID=A0A803JK14_XENTR|nr:mitochondrial potassium channel isoform X2 [Xenopus tropicalis]XP_012816086.1 mitochondrial potassium channel isoform X2 [Xenopus tropicalis]|eukprot:XP_012816083.1 PREDICTED: coiled-coil domain-containing protein 51 isoform X1 [Xenopus tropicalis]
MPNCIVKGCRHKSGQKIQYPDVVLHPFPNNINLIKNWLLQTGQDLGDIDVLADKILKGKKTANYRMCSCHFTRDSYMARGSKTTLKPNAVPTIFPIILPPAVVCSQISLPPAKRLRVEDEVPSTSAAVVRIVSKLVTVHTQTDDRVFRRDASVNTYNWPMQVDVATQTDPQVETKVLKTETKNESQEVKGWAAEMDHLYHKKSTKKTINKSFISNVVRPTVQEQAGRFLGVCPSRLFQEPSAIVVQRDFVKQKKFIVFEDSLDILLSLVRCQHSQLPPCQAPVSHIEKKVDGSLLTVHLTCLSGHNSLVWSAQPVFGNISIGNVLMASTILLSSVSLKKVLEMFHIFGIPASSPKTYHEYQKAYLFPAVDSQWRLEEGKIKAELAENPVALATGRQVINLGHFNKYCMYSMMDVMSKKIVSFKPEHFGPESILGDIGKEALQICLDQLIYGKVNVKIIATDQHVGIRKLMEIKYPHIEHQLDVWQLCKIVAQRLEETSKKRKCGSIARWIPAITNHLWWSAQTCKQNVNLLIDKWKSVLFHVANVHHFPSLKLYQKCQHERISKMEEKNTEWIHSDHPAHAALAEIINDPLLLDDISKTETFCHTRDLEAFYRTIEKCQSEHLPLSIDELYARTILAALSYNRNVPREQTSVIWPELSNLNTGDTFNKVEESEWVPKSEDRESYLLDIMSDSVKILFGGLQYNWISVPTFLPQTVVRCKAEV